MHTNSLLVFIAITVAAFAVVKIWQIGDEVWRNRMRLVDIEQRVIPSEVRPFSRRGLRDVLAWQWWTYGPFLLLAALAYWKLGPGFEMYLMLGGAAFWLIGAVFEPALD